MNFERNRIPLAFVELWVLICNQSISLRYSSDYIIWFNYFIIKQKQLRAESIRLVVNNQFKTLIWACVVPKTSLPCNNWKLSNNDIRQRWLAIKSSPTHYPSAEAPPIKSPWNLILSSRCLPAPKLGKFTTLSSTYLSVGSASSSRM